MEAIIFADAHASEADEAGVKRLEGFLGGECRRAEKVYILGDLFDFWFGPKQAAGEPYKGILRGLRELAGGGTEVVFFHGNRDFYVDEELAAQYSFRLVRDYAIEEICGRRVLMCHGDMLCANDVKYHRARAILRHPVTEMILKRLPAWVARRAARILRAGSKREVASKPKWVLGIDEGAARRHFAFGAELIICGHTHSEGKRVFDVGGVPMELYQLGDFGTKGCYMECGGGAFEFRRAWETNGKNGKRGGAAEDTVAGK